MPWTGSAPNQTFVRTDGTRTGPQTWQEADAADVRIISSAHDTHDEDVADGVEATLKRDGGNSPSAAIDWNGQLIVNYGAPTARTNGQRVDKVQDSSHVYAGTSAGTDTITATLSPAITAYVTGQRYHFKAGGTNTGAATINFNSVGAKDIKKGAAGSTALGAGDVTSGGSYTVTYDGTNFQLLNPGTQNLVPQPLNELLTEIAALSTDPNADSGLFFDDSAGAMAYWTPTGALSFSGTNLAVASASDTVVGVAELAVQSEMETATDVARIVTPGRQHFHPGHPKAWAYISVAGGTPTLETNYNITSIADTAQGRVTVTIATDFSSANWAHVVGTDNLYSTTASKAAGSIILESRSKTDASLIDPAEYNFAGFGDL